MIDCSVKPIGAEEWVKRFDASLKEVVLGGPCSDAAVGNLRALGLTDGDIEYHAARRGSAIKAGART